MTRIAARCERRRYGDALQARAATPSGLSRFASSCQHRIAIACVTLAYLTVLYFLFQIGRAL